jgi:hypothetical protein
VLDGLTNQHAVKGVAVKGREFVEVEDRPLFKGQRRDAVMLALDREKPLRGVG